MESNSEILARDWDDDFVKKMQYSYYTKDALSKDYDKVSFFARKEGLNAHARAVDIRFGKEDRD